MLSPDYYDKCTKQLVELYSELDNAIISDITRRLLKNGEMTETAVWQAKQLQEAGMVYEDILAEVSARSGRSQNEIKRIFEEAGVTATRNDNVFAKAAGFKEIRTFSKAALQTLNAGYVKCAGDMSNLTLTTANTSQQLYISAVNNAYMQIMSGAFDYNTAIRNAVRSAAAEGAEVMYPSGHIDKLDVAVRRSVLTGVGQTCRKLSEINAQEMGTDLMEITAHSGARPSHAEWQGQVVSMSGRKVYLSKYDIGYGTGDGFGGWNCRHDWYPFFEGISTRAYTDERLKELNAKNIEYNGEMYSEYEISQMQRKMERDIRQLKREAVAADTGAKNASSEELAKQFSDDFTRTSVKLKAKEQKLKDFLNETGQLPDSSRVWSNGFDRSVSQKAVHANKKALTNKDFNDIIALKGTFSNYDARAWYLAHDKKIPDLIDKSKSIEEQARQACELRNTYRTQARDLMADQVARKELDRTDPNKSFEEHINSKMKRKNMTYDEAVADILKTSTKTRKSVNKQLGLEE